MRMFSVTTGVGDMVVILRVLEMLGVGKDGRIYPSFHHFCDLKIFLWSA